MHVAMITKSIHKHFQNSCVHKFAFLIYVRTYMLDALPLLLQLMLAYVANWLKPPNVGSYFHEV